MTNPPPLQGLKVLEFAGLAPGPFAGLLLADAGAQILRIDRAIPGKTHVPNIPPPAGTDFLTRHKASIAIDLKSPGGKALIRALTLSVDILIDPYRPGVLDRLGLGPDVLCVANPRLIYARMTGFRRDGRYATMAGHDINYLAVSGVLSMLGRAGAKPHAPINILGDFAGGGAVLFQGIILALLARARSGVGQVVEANMVDGANYIASFPRLARKTSSGDGPRGENLLDGGCPFYDTYETRDGRYVSVGALEPQFFDVLVRGLGLEGRGWDRTQMDRGTWPEMRAAFEAVFKSRTRGEWEAVFDGTDACCLPVLEYGELENDADREGDQRPVVTLQDTPCLAVSTEAEDQRLQGQGAGVAGDGYTARPLGFGEGGVEALQEWFGFSIGRDFDVERGGLVLTSKPKL
ncbi:alpha-methylacyl-CoA racemase [Xylaria nigripes]|nr:alpha-methylacyl-CoA racemase [Xylaria nigripes]